MASFLDQAWLPAPTDLTLASHDVHVWRMSLGLPSSQVETLRQTLAPDELSRASRFRFEKERRRFIVARGMLRRILGRYLGVDPGQLGFSYTDYGKPALISPSRPQTLNFNLSHSHQLALIAITDQRQVGIDVEHVRPIPDLEDLAQRFFSAQENAALQALPEEEKLRGFFNCWTRKEAYIKARGEGLSLPLGQFDVSLTPGEPARLLSVRGAPREAARWSLLDLVPAPGYVAALAVEGHASQLSQWGWPEGSPTHPGLV
jgi:4'-phosphopantetheinyl transferase